MQSMSPIRDAGWKTYVPRLLYEHIVTTLILPMQRLLENATDVDIQSITGVRGYGPYTLEEFHDIIALQYQCMLTNGDTSQKAIVYHTTLSNRNRNVGWYHIYEYNMHPIEVVPDPIQNEGNGEQRSFGDYFWSGICYHDDMVNIPGRELPACVRLSIGHILVGKLVLTHYGHHLGRMESRLTVEEVTFLHGHRISEHHTMKDLWPDSKQFSDFVKNCMKNTLKWEKYPFTNVSGLSGKQRSELIAKHEVCHRYKVHGIDQGIDDQLKESITAAMMEKKFLPLLDLASKGMNSEIAFFLMATHDFLNEQCVQLCNEAMSSQKVASDLRKLWCGQNYILSDIL
jgi:hypothetical protein